jgi:hypothetical protein
MAPGAVVHYSAVSAGLSTPTRSFRVPAVGAASTVRAVLTADMGATTPDRASQHWAEMDAYATTANMQSWGVDRGVDLAFNVGDLSYATGYLGKWETFMTAIEPVASAVPYVVAQGNHEQDWPLTGVVTNGPETGRDSGGECGIPTARRFVVPSSDGGPIGGRSGGGGGLPIPYWYSFDSGPVHFCIVNTEIASLWNGTQMEWLEADLMGVDRRVTPWVVVMGHRACTPTRFFLQCVFSLCLYPLPCCFFSLSLSPALLFFLSVSIPCLCCCFSLSLSPIVLLFLSVSQINICVN